MPSVFKGNFQADWSFKHLKSQTQKIAASLRQAPSHSQLLRPAWVAMAHPNYTSSPVLLCVCPSPLSFFLFLGLGLPLWLLTRWQFLVEGVHQCINSK